MDLTKKSPKVASVEVRPKKQNNPIAENKNVINIIKLVLNTQLIFGINRTYLLKRGRFVSWVSKMYSIAFIILILLQMLTYKSESVTYYIIQYVSCFEFIFLVLNSMIFQRKTFEYLIENMNMYDDILNITEENLNIMHPKFRCIIWIFVTLAFSAMEYHIGLYITDFDYTEISMTVLCTITIMAHDGELLLFVLLLRMVYVRAQIMKAHVKKKFGKVDSKELNKMDAISNNTQLDTTTMHRTYNLLHKCAEQLNSIMNLPVIKTISLLIPSVFNIIVIM